jgi:predicted DNA-binding transcriptional regulator AlpA
MTRRLLYVVALLVLALDFGFQLASPEDGQLHAEGGEEAHHLLHRGTEPMGEWTERTLKDGITFMHAQIDAIAVELGVGGSGGLLTTEDAAKRLGVTVDWLYRNWKKIPSAVKLGRRSLRFDPAGLDRYLASQRRRTR